MELDAWIEDYRIAWERGDVELAASLFTEDATYRSLIFDEAHEGQQGVAAYWARVTSSQEDVSVQMGRPYVDGDRVAVEWWTRMTAEGQVITLPGCLFLRFAPDGRCRQLHEYWNLQEGAAEPPPEWGT